MVKVVGSQKTKKNDNRPPMRKFINLAEIWGIFNMHHWLKEWTPLVTR